MYVCMYVCMCVRACMCVCVTISQPTSLSRRTSLYMYIVVLMWVLYIRQRCSQGFLKGGGEIHQPSLIFTGLFLVVLVESSIFTGVNLGGGGGGPPSRLATHMCMCIHLYV